MRRSAPLPGRAATWWLGLWLLLSGCEAGYYLHLAWGQARIALRAAPLEELLASPAMAPATRDKLQFVAALREFARDRLGLKTSTSYTRFFDTGGQPISWNVSASPPDRFAPYLWRFPIVGSMPYKGFFSRERAIRERDRLRALGLDVVMGPVSAYSTLGFFSDPVLSTMLDYPEDSLADLILHELTHATIYAEGQADFNESLATFVGQTGSLEFLAARYGPNSPLIQQAVARREDARRFGDFVQSVVVSLDSLYALGLPRQEVLVRRQEVFALAKQRYRSWRGEFAASNWDGFLEWEVNNAQLLSYRRYHLNLELFARIYQLQGERLDRAIVLFKDCEGAADPWACLQAAI